MTIPGQIRYVLLQLSVLATSSLEPQFPSAEWTHLTLDTSEDRALTQPLAASNLGQPGAFLLARDLEQKEQIPAGSGHSRRNGNSIQEMKSSLQQCEMGEGGDTKTLGMRYYMNVLIFVW